MIRFIAAALTSTLIARSQTPDMTSDEIISEPISEPIVSAPTGIDWVSESDAMDLFYDYVIDLDQKSYAMWAFDLYDLPKDTFTRPVLEALRRAAKVELYDDFPYPPKNEYYNDDIAFINPARRKLRQLFD
jgi:hypothetical protein